MTSHKDNWSCESVQKRMESLQDILGQERDAFGKKETELIRALTAARLEIERLKDQALLNAKEIQSIRYRCDRWREVAKGMAEALKELTSYGNVFLHLRNEKGAYEMGKDALALYTEAEKRSK